LLFSVDGLQTELQAICRDRDNTRFSGFRAPHGHASHREDGMVSYNHGAPAHRARTDDKFMHRNKFPV